MSWKGYSISSIFFLSFQFNSFFFIWSIIQWSMDSKRFDKFRENWLFEHIEISNFCVVFIFRVPSRQLVLNEKYLKLRFVEINNHNFFGKKKINKKWFCKQKAFVNWFCWIIWWIWKVIWGGKLILWWKMFEQWNCELVEMNAWTLTLCGEKILLFDFVVQIEIWHCDEKY